MQLTELILWYFWTQAFAVGGSLLARGWLRRLPDQGYGVGKALGVLLGGSAYWLAVTLGFATNNVGAALLGLACVWALAFFTNDGRQTTNVRQSFIIITEILFAVAFFGWAWFRAHTPEIVEAGGEKFMESMMINAILRSPSFPPTDAWLAGNAISYYYFGYVIFAMLIHVSGVAPSIAFNLGGAMIFAFTITSAFSVGFNLWAAFSRGQKLEVRLEAFSNDLRSILAGLLTAIMLAIMGNMGGLMGALKCGNALPTTVWRWLDVREIANKQVACNGLAPAGWFDWWWDWSRVVKDTTPNGQTQEVITESPIFSFILGDNHPHVMVLPFAILTLAVALNQLLYRGYEKEETTAGRSVLTFVLNAITIGGIAFMNTIDFPMYAVIFLVASLLGRRIKNEPIVTTVVACVLTLIAAYLIYLPFHVTLSSQVKGIVPNLFNGTRFAQFFLIFAPMIVACVGFIAFALRQQETPIRSVASQVAKLVGLAIACCLLAVILFGVTNAESRAFAAELQNNGVVQGITREQVTSRLIERAISPWTTVFLVAVTAFATTLTFNALKPRVQTDPSIDPSSNHSLTPSLSLTFSRSPTDLFALALFVFGALVTLAVEFVYIRDFFGTRLNSVFKFYYQTWVLWTVAGAYATMRLLGARGVFGKLVGVVCLALVAVGLLFPAFGIPSKITFSRDAYGTQQPTLDGMDWLRRSRTADGKLIDWLNANVNDDAVILETPHEGSYDYKGRISAFTGLPTPVGWAFHELQWRGAYDQAGVRKSQVDQLFNTTDPLEAQTRLRELKVKYVVIGDTERQSYPPEGLDKFAQICKTAFQSGNTVLYRCE
jgi:YYY domain-containing protein